MRKLHLYLTLVVLLIISNTGLAKTFGNFKSYKQVTDKEVLVESSNGIKVLFTAYNNFAIGVSTTNSNEEVKLTSPHSIAKRNDLTGSIYVEEIDELMQITTTSADGLIIKVEKNPLRFTYIDKSSNQVLFEEEFKFGNKSHDLGISVESGEEYKLITSNNYQSNTLPIKLGDILDYACVNDFLYPENEICMLSSKGFAIVLNADIKHNIDYKKEDRVKISADPEAKGQGDFQFMLVYGAMQPELIEKYAFHSTPFDKQISLK